MNNTAMTVVSAAAHAALMSAADIRAQVNTIQEVMKAVMKPNVHYGVIPGTGNKPTLYKPGAEVLCATFRIAPEYDVENLSTPDCYRYRVRCRGRHQASGIVLAEGLGSASSNEKKYKWRAALCDEEFEATPVDRRRVAFKKGSNKIYKVNEIRAEPDDIDNTVLKMACKRAQVAMTLNATAASDIFTQDIEDLPPELRSQQQEGGDEGGGEPRDERKPYPQDQFDKNLAVWQQLIETGKKSAEHIIANIESRATLTDAQKAKIAEAKPKQEAAAATPPEVTKEALLARFEKTTDVDVLNADATLITALAEADRDAARTAYRNRLNALKEAA